MDSLLNWVLRVLALFGPQQLTADEVLVHVPTDWICTIHGHNSLRMKLQREYELGSDGPGDGELYGLLKILEARGLIELETRLWQNPYDNNHYLHQQCRKARGGTPFQTTSPELGRIPPNRPTTRIVPGGRHSCGAISFVSTNTRFRILY